ncbi:MAG TPA: hypothetical protein VM733_08585 [Thermoanaerobaculia bacterium]|nr:hypothetical protein [Thermoanaerobaculia bacterium]
MIYPGEVAWYATGRFYVSSKDQSLFDAGFFIHLAGIDGSLFANDTVNEANAFFTFAAEPFTAKPYTNGALALGLDTVGGFSVYLQNDPCGTFEDPSSFAKGRCIATFERVSVVVGATVGTAVLSNAFSARLASSTPFEFCGVTYDLAELLPHGITQWGTASPQAIAPPPAGYSTVLPFIGSAIKVG